MLGDLFEQLPDFRSSSGSLLVGADDGDDVHVDVVEHGVAGDEENSLVGDLDGVIPSPRGEFEGGSRAKEDEGANEMNGVESRCRGGPSSHVVAESSDQGPDGRNDLLEDQRPAGIQDLPCVRHIGFGIREIIKELVLRCCRGHWRDVRFEDLLLRLRVSGASQPRS